ncbi:MAG: MBOAT family protein [Planctomycetaceae bacterium]
MCAISLSLYLLIVHVLTHYTASGEDVSPLDSLAWFFGWPGLDARAFRQALSTGQHLLEVLFAVAKVGFGGGMLFLVAPSFRVDSPLVSGWAALTGLVFLLHFGTFHLAALFWRSHGRDVKPIMNAPILATSVAEFWSRRWNLAFRDYASPFLFVPLMRKTNSAVAVLVGYTFSGLIHELAISVPVGGGYGLPTLYFATQGAATLIERSAEKRGIGMTTGLLGWCWTAIVTVPGAFVLFHPAFVRAVVLPVVDFVAGMS